MYLELGRIEDAKNMALDVLSGNRNHAQAWALLGDTHRAERDWDNAMECYHRALLIRADYPKVQLAVAELYRLRGRPERAMSTLDRMTDLNANIAEDPNHMLLRGMTFADLQRNQEAAVLLANGSERLPPDQWRRQLEVAETQFRLGELVDARLTLGRIPEPSSQDPAVTAFRDKLDASFQQWAATHPGELPTNLQARIMNSSDASAGNPNFAGPNALGFRIAAQTPPPPAANGPKAPAAPGSSLPEPKSLRALHAGFPKTGQQP
jgi:tetratricopeptide (TPR) repeat protein